MALASQFFSATIGFTGDFFNGWGDKHPRTSLMEMAAAIDKLEQEVDEFGSVVVKQPDVWGEARWTQHRQQYEEQLKKEVDQFKFTLNAKQTQSDSAFFLDAMALGNALQSTDPEANTSATVSQVFNKDAFPAPEFLPPPGFSAVSPKDPATQVAIAIEPEEYLDQLSTYLGHLNQLRRINEGDDTADAAGYALNLMRLPVSVLPGDKTRTGYGAEITFSLTPELTEDLLPTTFKDLVLNDLVDQLGLPIVKLAECRAWQLPSEGSQVAKATEIATYQAAIRSLNQLQEINDLNWGTLTAEQKQDTAKRHTELLKKVSQIANGKIGNLRMEFDPCVPQEARPDILQLRETIRNDILSKYKELNLEQVFHQSLDDLLGAIISLPADSLTQFYLTGKTGPLKSQGVQKHIESFVKSLADGLPEYLATPIWKNIPEIGANLLSPLLGQFSNVVANRVQAFETMAVNATKSGSVSISAPRDRQARYAIPPTEIACVFGIEQLTCIAQDLDRVRETNGGRQLQLSDSHGFLSEELEAAYRLLVTLQQMGCSAWLICPQISQAVGRLQYGQGESELAGLRTTFCTMAAANMPACSDSCRGCTIRALAWAILVESAMLNDRLIQDMQRVQTATGISFLPASIPAFYDPKPDSAASAIFNEYVRVRWPIHVFAIDPVIQEQNVSDAFARRRETQLALSLAFTRGEMSAQNFSRFSRRVDYELDTIALNRTIVGFSHGNDTFGWRMYPRVQTPPIDGNMKVFFRDLLVGPPGRDQDLRKRQLEPGPRELMAIVIMPAFVPTVRMDMRSNWFELKNPDEKKFTTEDSVRMGQMIQYMRNCKSQCLTEDCMSRPGDARRLLQAVDQLEKRLPLQDALVQIPYENSDGGFQLFSEGTRNLGPELIGFYGEPGLDPKSGGKLFLVGRNFNVNVTKVVIGGQECTFDLLSREVMKVNVPGNLNVMEVVEYVRGIPQRNQVIDAHVGTPYGISGHLQIPAMIGSDSQPKYQFAVIEAKACLIYDGCTAVSLMLPEALKLKGVSKGDEVTISLSAVLDNAQEKVLKVPNADPKKDPESTLKFTMDDSSTIGLAALLRFFASGEKIFFSDHPIALKLSAKVQGKADQKAVDVPGPLVIRLGGCGTSLVTTPSACGACQPGKVIMPTTSTSAAPTPAASPIGDIPSMPDITPPAPVPSQSPAMTDGAMDQSFLIKGGLIFPVADSSDPVWRSAPK
ncbi:hypothetical protein [Planctomicrobium piriforme]|uniref:hypothetical protein n=1 Tax=Planctomicrobium piriforme TaxID=1576369 RepID=UPI0011142128|nr:hypothetical protein [Planctomicrobium piriforme]